MTISTLSDTRPSSLLEAWRGIQQAKPGIRIREAAKALGTSEAVLLSTLTGDNVVKLQGPWPSLLLSFKTLGRIMSLTRNDACILEHKGSFQEIDIMGEGIRAMATVIGPVELRVFFQAWTYAFAVREEKQDRVLQSIQVFDNSGEAIIKIFIQEQSDEKAYRKIIEDFRHPNQLEPVTMQAYPTEAFSSAIDESAFLSEWASLKDTHDFFGVLRKHNVHRYRALELAAGKFTYPVAPATAPRQILDGASASKFPIMIFAGNRGNIQIHQGKVRTIRVLERGHGGMENWLNVLDPDFNMHLRMDLVHSAWVVRKPTDDGVVTSVELFDKEKNMVAQFFGLRKPGIPEREAWRELVEDLPVV